jgi:hypothetical protein
VVLGEDLGGEAEEDGGEHRELDELDHFGGWWFFLCVECVRCERWFSRLDGLREFGW